MAVPLLSDLMMYVPQALPDLVWEVSRAASVLAVNTPAIILAVNTSPIYTSHVFLGLLANGTLSQQPLQKEHTTLFLSSFPPPSGGSFPTNEGAPATCLVWG